MWQKFKKWLNLDHIIDLSVDLFLILFDVLSSPILIVMRLIRYVVGKYMLDGLKNKIKKFVKWIRGKPIWVQIIIIPMVIIVTAYILVLMWIFGQAWGQFVADQFGKGINATE